MTSREWEWEIDKQWPETRRTGEGSCWKPRCSVGGGEEKMFKSGGSLSTPWGLEVTLHSFLTLEIN